MKYKNYIWDFDGTLFDSYPHIFSALCRVMDEAGLTEEFDMELVRRHLRVSFASLYEFTRMPDEPWARFIELHHRTNEDGVSPAIEPFADCEAVLAAVIDRGGRNFIYTHRNATVYTYLERYDLTKYFSDILTAEENFPYKPAPDAVLALIERNALVPGECIMIGDREIDGLSGKNAGIAGALVCYPEALPDGTSPVACSRMDYVAPTLTEFAEMMGIFEKKA